MIHLMNDIQTTNQVKGQISELKQKFFEKINEFYAKHLEILNDESKPIEQRRKEVEELIKQYSEMQFQNTSREDQIAHKNNDAPLARNRHIIQAELNEHLMQYDDNWDHNQDHAGGKYTTIPKNEWLAKKAKLESELKNTAN